MDKVSIVVAVYNAEKILRKCVDSLLNQTYKNIEIILVNDCSKDNSLSVCKEYESKYNNIVVVNNAENLGVSATRNNGIEASTGEYICFVDSDDYVEPDYIEKLYYYCKKYSTVPVCGFVYHDELNKMPPRNYGWSGDNELISLGQAFRLNAELYLTALWNKMFDNFVIKSNNIRFDENLSMGEDLRFSVDYFQKNHTNEIFVFSDYLYHYTKLSENSLMSEFARGDINEGIRSLEIIRDLAIKYNRNANEEFDEAVILLKNNYTYLIIRDSKFSKKEKIEMISRYDKNYNEKNYRRDRISYIKERFVSCITTVLRRKN